MYLLMLSSNNFKPDTADVFGDGVAAMSQPAALTIDGEPGCN
jgi:hypothetical protein